MTKQPELPELDLNQLIDLRDLALNAIHAAKNLEELKTVRLEYLGDKSPLALANRTLGKLSAENRAIFGAALVQHRRDLTEVFEASLH